MDPIEWLKKNYADKVVNANEAISKIKEGSRVFISTGCSEPQHLIRTMATDTSLSDILIYQMLSRTLAEYVENESFLSRFSLKLFFISHAMRKAAFEGKIDYVPAYLSQIPELFTNKILGLDVALIQVSLPDQFGYCSLGISVDITRSGMQNAKTVIAQVNPQMPKTWGYSLVHVDEIDYFVAHDEPLLTTNIGIPDNEISQRIGHYVAQLVNDGATLQIGLGQLPLAILKSLAGKKDLGIHTLYITDAFLPLFETRVITNQKKSFTPGRAVTSLCMGSQRLYDYVNDNPMFVFTSSAYVNHPAVIALNDNLISISSASEVDLTGQVFSDSVGYLFYGADRIDLMRGSAMSKGGFSIIVLPSTAAGGNVSRIVSHPSEGAHVATTREDVNYVVTEYGIAELKGKTLYQRVMELAQIAHPSFRKALIKEAKKRHYIFADQLPPHQEDLIFLERYKSTFQLIDGRTVELRPLLPSDEAAFRNFYYSLKARTIYLRFFRYRKLFSHKVIQEQWANVDYRENMSIIGLISMGGHKEIIAIGSYDKDKDESSMAELAMMIHDDFQGKGIGTHLLEVLEEIAIENRYKGFSGTVLDYNTAMLRVVRKRYPNCRKASIGNEVKFVMDFEDNVREV